MVHQEQLSFETAGHRHMADLTDQVAVIHLECNVRPRRRTVVVTVMGE